MFSVAPESTTHLPPTHLPSWLMLPAMLTTGVSSSLAVLILSPKFFFFLFFFWRGGEVFYVGSCVCSDTITILLW
ncbi:hypothetical protein Hanom_Chr07g00581921 [Helianthus anomalus]